MYLERVASSTAMSRCENPLIVDDRPSATEFSILGDWGDPRPSLFRGYSAADNRVPPFSSGVTPFSVSCAALEASWKSTLGRFPVEILRSYRRKQRPKLHFSLL